MTTTPIVRTVVAFSAAALLLAGCGGSSEGGDASPSTSGAASSSAPSETAAPPLTDDQNRPDRLVVDVTIEGGKVTPTNEALEGKLGQPIVIRVNSDVADELHVHSTPEHTFAIEPKQGQQFQFTVDVPGKVDVELHELHRTVATITVR